MSKPWLETWWVHNNSGAVFEICRKVPDGSDLSDCVAKVTDWGIPFKDQESIASLVAAAPALVRALLAVEWSERLCGGCTWYECPGCWNDKRQFSKTPEHPHGDACPIDAALTAAGLPDRISRDAARRVKP